MNIKKKHYITGAVKEYQKIQDIYSTAKDKEQEKKLDFYLSKIRFFARTKGLLKQKQGEITHKLVNQIFISQ